MSLICYLLASFIFFCRAVGVFDPVERDIDVTVLGLFFTALGLALGGVALPFTIRRP